LSIGLISSLKAACRSHRAQLPTGIDRYRTGRGRIDRRAIDVLDIAAVVHVCTCGADTDNVSRRSDVVAGENADDRVALAGGVVECFITIGRVPVAGVAKQSECSMRCVGGAVGVVNERFITGIRSPATGRQSPNEWLIEFLTGGVVVFIFVFTKPSFPFPGRLIL
jgi:hypothetical protein